ncbi:MAG: SOS response-associated peptidase [Bacillota bacterium]
MCGRYYIALDYEELREILYEARQNAKKSEHMAKTGEIFPADIAPVLTAGARPQAMRWGFARNDGKGCIINARSETAAQKAMFQRALREGRCLIPASNYFEWEALPDGKKRKYAIFSGEPVLYMAGLYRQEPGAELPAFVVLTKEAERGISFLHDRMPVILTRAEQLSWLNGELDVKKCGGTVELRAERVEK